MGATVVSGAALWAAEEGGNSNFLIPNGTFFFILAIFLVVFGIITKFVVIPVQKVLDERDRMVSQTTQDNREAAEQDQAAESEYRSELTTARSEAGALRDQARTTGREDVDALKAQANEEVAAQLRDVSDDLRAEGDALAPQLQSSVQALSEDLARRILGASDLPPTAGHR